MRFLPIPLASQLHNAVIVPGCSRLGKPKLLLLMGLFGFGMKVKNLYSAVLSVKAVNLIASHWASSLARLSYHSGFRQEATDLDKLLMRVSKKRDRGGLDNFPQIPG